MSKQHAEAASGPGPPGVLCPCGRPLHYSNPRTRRLVEEMVADLGPNILIRRPAGAWRVPRHYIALHGLKTAELPDLALKYGWPQLSGPRAAAANGSS